MKLKSILVLCVVGAIGVVHAAGVRTPNEARVAEIAALLPENPTGPTPYDREGKNDVKLGEALLKAPVADAPDALYLEFSQNGNRTHYQQAYYRRTGNLRKLVAAECAEKQGRFIPKIAAYLTALNTQRTWVLPAHDRGLENFNNTSITVDLVSSDIALMLAEILLKLEPALPADVVAQTRAEMNRRVFSIYLADIAVKKPKNWWFYGNANWTAVCHANCVRAALLGVADRVQRARCVEAALRAMPVFLSGFTPDGYCSEGMGYWEYGFGHYLDLGNAIKDATGGKVDLFKEGGDRARAAAGYPFAFQIQKGVSPHFADGGGNPSNKRRRECAAIWPEYAAQLEGTLPIRSTFPDAQVFVSRTLGDRPFAVALKGGHNGEFHNHNDVGTWTLMLDGQELAGDPGGEVYTARTFSKDRYVSKVLSSFGHPVPRIAGQLQPPGRKFCGKVLKTEFAEDKDEVVLDLAGAYDVKGITKLVRTTVFDRAGRVFTVTDDIAFATPQALDVPLITYCDVTKGADKTSLTFTTKKGSKAAVAIAVQGGEWELQEEEIENPGKPSPKRLAVAFAQPVVAATVSFTLKEEK
ncbi:MAG: heparinase II/III-family protein [Kiritimatiellae bacterium]|nr:heparinase II/III-family protein [Kiritimatiellia bacterium]